MAKAAEAFRTISEVGDELEIPKHVLRFWEGKFTHIKPMKRGGGRRYYRPEDMELLRGIKQLLHGQGFTIRGVQRILRERGVDEVKMAGRRPGEANATIAALNAAEGGTPERARGATGRRKPLLAVDQRRVLLGVLAELEACSARLLRPIGGEASTARTAR